MPRILLSASFPSELILRQTPGRTGRWKEFEFVGADNLNPDSKAEQFDGWVVYDDMPTAAEYCCPRSNTLLITGEPESIRRYRRRYTSQFGRVWSSQAAIQHPHVKRRNEGQHWHYALSKSSVHGCQLGFDELEKLQCPSKTKLASVICSAKASTADHRKRFEFVKALKDEFGDQIDWFGRGTREIEDKAEAIYSYRYHIVLENDHSEFFMTEKLADAYLGWSYPIYFGGTEAYYRYPEGSFTAIDIYNPREAMSILHNVLDSDTFEQSLLRIAEARKRVLYSNNICNMMAEFFREYLTEEAPSPTRLLPKNHRAGLVYGQVKRALQHPFRRSHFPRSRAA
ncbi:MAG: glycosyltransferase family 10 [Planctomycetota bacterium]